MSSVPTTRTHAGHLPGEVGIWVFIMGDMTVFGLFFCTFMYYRAQEVAEFVASQPQLHQNFGAINTLLLLTSSWFVATGVKAARRGMGRLTPRLFSLALLCGLGFCAVKFFEYRDLIERGITLTTNDFFMYYFVFTGIHLLHLVIGMGVLLFMTLHLRNTKATDVNQGLIEGGACYWHMVDLLWIVLFPLLYLVK